LERDEARALPFSKLNITERLLLAQRDTAV
jgi:hypothetical protein